MKLKTFLYGSMLGWSILLTSCGDDDLKKANSVAINKITFTRDRTIGVEVIYSDSARVKAKGNAPIMDKITPSEGAVYQEMPKGVNIDFFNPNGTIDGNLVCDYAIRKDQDKKTEFRKNVVVKNSKGDTFSSQELIWDEIKKIFYSTQRVYVKGADGSVGEGINFEAPQDFSTYTMESGNADLNMKEGIAP
ncbi:LptA/OstA family protein [Pedobacter agri]|uniref:LPS export ABC transporter periplasmic protein LptC n=1 Tax=Pedobacter agri TaxID=454586 RepID=UPI00292FCCB9|nr:LPS export ABC transporter periplasmic protein LptC [Pedobacter agri]